MLLPLFSPVAGCSESSSPHEDDHQHNVEKAAEEEGNEDEYFNDENDDGRVGINLHLHDFKTLQEQFP